MKPYVKKRHFRREKFPYLEKNLQLLGLEYLKAQLFCLRRKRAFYGEKNSHTSKKILQLLGVGYVIA